VRTLDKQSGLSSRATVSIALIIIVIVVSLGIVFSHRGTTITSSSMLTSSTSTSAVLSSTNSSTTPNTLVIDDANWPEDDLNQLYTVFELPWPNWLFDTVYQPLIYVNQTAQFDTGVIQYLPALAANWSVSNGGSTYTFNLRKDVYFSDGNPFNAYQVWLEMYAFYYLSGNSTSWLESYNLFNMSAVNFGPSTISMINSTGGVVNPSHQTLSIMTNSSWPIYVAGPYQIVFQLKAPFQYFPGLFVAYDGLMFDTQWVLQHGGFGTPTQFNPYFNQHPIPGSGPYVVTQVSENNYVQFTQNPNYWGKNLTSSVLAVTPIFEPGHVKNVIVYYKPSGLVRYTDLSSGASQVSMIGSSAWSFVRQNPTEYSYFRLPPWSGEVLAIAFNTQTYPTNITDFRLAIVHAINYTHIADTVFDGYLTPFVGPEYPAWKQFYDLGNYSPYQYNLTLARQFLSAANIHSVPALNFTEISGCDYCNEIAEIVQSELAQIGISVNIVVQTTSEYYAPYSSYSAEVSTASQIGQLSLLGAEEWGPTTLTPADYWFDFVTNESQYGDWAIYSNPSVVQCANAFTSTTNISFIQDVCAVAQKQIYDQAPYAWLGVSGLWYGADSLVWKTSVIKGFLVDPVWDGQDTAPIFNTVIFANST
jgi:peptide/nickel transport system substrate-binding protein